MLERRRTTNGVTWGVGRGGGRISVQIAFKGVHELQCLLVRRKYSKTALFFSFRERRRVTNDLESLKKFGVYMLYI